MAKKQNKRQPKMGKKKKTRAAVGKARVSRRLTPAAKLAAAMLDPFSKSACIPDASAGTGCFSVKQQITFATIAGGSSGGLVFTCDPVNLYSADLSCANATPTFNAATSWSQASSLAVIQSLYRAWRPTSMGMRASFVGNTQTDGGVILVGTVPATTYASIFNGLSIVNASSLMRDYQLVPLREGFVCTWKPDSMDDMIAFRPTNEANTNLASATAYGVTVPYLMFIIYGANASQTNLSVELIVNYEGQVANQTILAGGNRGRPQEAAETGWYEKTMSVVNQFSTVTPYMTAAFEGYKSSGLLGAASGIMRTMGNGIEYPVVLPQSQRRLLSQ